MFITTPRGSPRHGLGVTHRSLNKYDHPEHARRKPTYLNLTHRNSVTGNGAAQPPSTISLKTLNSDSYLPMIFSETGTRASKTRPTNSTTGYMPL